MENYPQGIKSLNRSQCLIFDFPKDFTVSGISLL